MFTPIFITARFRTGSTLLWNIFHQIPEANAYYEPCHEKLPQMIRVNTPPQATHFNVDTYFREYPPVDELAQRHTSALGVCRLHLEANEDYPELKSWIEYLRDYAYGLNKRPVFQFNRVDFRLPWLKANFPEAKIIHLYRSPRDQWLSSIAGYPDSIDGNIDVDPYLITTWARDLCEQFPFLAADFIRHPYQRHYYLWKLSYLAGSRLANLSLSYEDLLENPRAGVTNILKVAEFDVEANLERCLKIIVQRPTVKWPQYNTEAWFSDLENECERVLDDLGLNDFFAVKPLVDIISANMKYQALAADPRVQQWLRRNAQTTIVHWENVADEKEAVISGLAAALHDRDAIIEEHRSVKGIINRLQADTERYKGLVDELQAAIQEKTAAIDVLQTAATERQKLLEELEASVIQHRELVVAGEHRIQVLEQQLAAERQLVESMRSISFGTAPVSWFDRHTRRFMGPLDPVVHPLKKLNARFRIASVPKLGRFHHYSPIRLEIPPHYIQSQTGKTTLPRISIVTPSYNQAAFIEQTIRSVLDQGYPNLDYIIQDGASTDNTLDVLEHYRSKLSHVESIRDNGQTHALNLGFAKSDGEIMAYLNSDDLLLPGSLHYVAQYFITHPQVDVVYGHRVIVDENEMEIGRWVLPRHNDQVLEWADYLPQETMFWRRSLWEACGGHFDENYNFAMDWELILRFRQAGARFVRLPRFPGAFRVHSHQKTTASILDVGQQEMFRLRELCHGRPVTQAEVNEAVRPYLRQHVIYHGLYRLGVLRY